MSGTACRMWASMTQVSVQDKRGRWSSLDGVTIFGWSGSALLGGYLLDEHGFSAVFAATAAMQFSGSLLVALLLPVVPRHEAAAAAAAAVAVPAEAAIPGSPSTVATAAAPAALRRSGSVSSVWSASGGEGRSGALPAQRLSFDGEAEVAASFSSSFRGR